MTLMTLKGPNTMEKYVELREHNVIKGEITHLNNFN